jgi:hypothetical protein
MYLYVYFNFIKKAEWLSNKLFDFFQVMRRINI